MTDPPTPEELAAQQLATQRLARSAFTFQKAALRFSFTPDVDAAREYVKRMRAHQKAVEEAHEAFKEPPADG